MSTYSVVRSLSGSIEWSEVLSLGRRLVAWWIDELEHMLPPRLRFDARGSSLILEVSRSAVRFRNGNGDILAAVAADAEAIGITMQALRTSFAAKHNALGPIVVEIERSLTLSRSIILPTAAASTLTPIVKHQLPKLVPMAVDDIVSIHEIVSRQTAAKTMKVRITLVKKATLTWIQDLAHGAGLQVRRIILDTSGAEGARTQRVLWRSPETLSSRTSRLFTRYRFVIGMITLLTLASVLHCLRVHVLDDRLLAEVASLQDQASSVISLNDRLHRETEQLALLNARTESISAADVLARLTVLLPSDVSLTQFTYQNGTVTCVGKARHAASLIGIIEKSVVFGRPHFVSATTPSSDGLGETFELAFSVLHASTDG